MPSTLKTGDKILIALLALALAGGGIWWAATQGQVQDEAREKDGLVVVTQTKDGQRRVDPLGEDLEFTVTTPGTGTGADAERSHNTVRIARGRVEVVESNCSNQVCVEHDPVSRPGGQIVCLPHGMVVEVALREQDVAKLQ